MTQLNSGFSSLLEDFKSSSKIQRIRSRVNNRKSLCCKRNKSSPILMMKQQVSRQILIDDGT